MTTTEHETTCTTHARIEPIRLGLVKWSLYQIVDGERVDLASGAADSIANAHVRIDAEQEIASRLAGVWVSIDSREIVR